MYGRKAEQLVFLFTYLLFATEVEHTRGTFVLTISYDWAADTPRVGSQVDLKDDQ